MVKLAIVSFLAAVSMTVATAKAETVQFEGLQFETPNDMPRFDGGPRPDAPFLRFRRGAATDPQFDVIEVMSTPASALAGRLSPENFAEFSLRPASMFCGEHQVLRNETRTIEGAIIVDVGYLCLHHSRSPELSRQIVRNIAVFHDDQMTMLQFVRRWRNAPHPDDQLTPEAWISPTDAFAASITRCGEDCLNR
jgi:hypothetical protein